MSILKHCVNDIGILEAYASTEVYNYNKAAIQRADSVTSKFIKQLNLRENMVNGCYQSKDIDVEHTPGIINPSDVFTKEMKDNTH